MEVFPDLARDEQGARDFQIVVRIVPEVLLGEGSGLVPGQDEVQGAEEALAWVLWALFAHAEALELKRAAFG